MNIDITPKIESKKVSFEIGEFFRLKQLTFRIIKIDNIHEELTLKVQTSVCEECGVKFYLRRKGKIRFCCPRCNWKNNSAKHRKKDPEKYRKYQRELMRKRYAKEKLLDK